MIARVWMHLLYNMSRSWAVGRYSSEIRIISLQEVLCRIFRVWWSHMFVICTKMRRGEQYGGSEIRSLNLSWDHFPWGWGLVATKFSPHSFSVLWAATSSTPHASCAASALWKENVYFGSTKISNWAQLRALSSSVDVQCVDSGTAKFFEIVGCRECPHSYTVCCYSAAQTFLSAIGRYKRGISSFWKSLLFRFSIKSLTKNCFKFGMARLIHSVPECLLANHKLCILIVVSSRLLGWTFSSWYTRISENLIGVFGDQVCVVSQRWPSCGSWWSHLDWVACFSKRVEFYWPGRASFHV